MDGCKPSMVSGEVQLGGKLWPGHRSSGHSHRGSQSILAEESLTTTERLTGSKSHIWLLTHEAGFKLTGSVAMRLLHGGCRRGAVGLNVGPVTAVNQQ